MAAKPNVAFICIHNSCRSQMAEAIARARFSDVMIPHSAGTELSRGIDPGAVGIIRDIYGVDMSETQEPKLLADLTDMDVAVTMGCGVTCPIVFAPKLVEWNIDDPSGEPREVYEATAREIESLIAELADELRTA